MYKVFINIKNAPIGPICHLRINELLKIHPQLGNQKNYRRTSNFSTEVCHICLNEYETTDPFTNRV